MCWIPTAAQSAKRFISDVMWFGTGRASEGGSPESCWGGEEYQDEWTTATAASEILIIRKNKNGTDRWEVF